MSPRAPRDEERRRQVPLYDFWILLQKELRVGVRSASLYLLIGVPLVVSLLMRAILSGEGAKPPKVAIVGQDRPALVQLVGQLDRAGRTPMRLVKVKDEAAGRRLLAKGKLQGLLVLSPQFDGELTAGRRPRATLYFDEAGGTSAFTLRTVVRELLRIQAKQREPARLEVRGIRGITPWEAMLPAWVVMVILSAITLMPSSIASERQSKTLQAVLVTPIRLWEFVVGKGLYGVVIGTVGGLLVLGANGALVGNLPLALAIVVLGATVATLIGLLIGMLVETQQGASGVSTALYIPLLWGAFFSDLGGVVGTLSRGTPSYYVAQGLKHALYSNGTWAGEWRSLAVLGGLAAVLFVATLWALRRAEERA
ncbi:MAG: ABC transporter permease [bacterium]